MNIRGSNLAFFTFAFLLAPTMATGAQYPHPPHPQVFEFTKQGIELPIKQREQTQLPVKPGREPQIPRSGPGTKHQMAPPQQQPLRATTAPVSPQQKISPAQAGPTVQAPTAPTKGR